MRLTICPRSSHPFYIVTYYIKWVTISWTFSVEDISKKQKYMFLYQTQEKSNFQRERQQDKKGEKTNEERETEKEERETENEERETDNEEREMTMKREK